MASTYYDSELTAEEIEAALEAIDGVISPSNNGKILYIEDGKIAAKSAGDFSGVTLEPLSVTQNGDYTPSTGVDGFDEVHVAVPNSYAAADEGKVVSNGALVAQTARSSQITQNGTYDTTLNDEVTVNVSGGSPTLQEKTVTQNGVVLPDSGYDGLSKVTVNVSGGGSITKVEMTSCPQQCYLYSAGNRGWAVYPATSGAENAETFYADIPVSHRNGGLIILSTERPSGESYKFTRNRIGFTDGTEDPADLPNGEAQGRTTQPSYYMNALSYAQDKQFSMVQVPNGMSRVYWTNTQSSYRVSGQKSYMWLISDADLISALNIDWKYYLPNSQNNENKVSAWPL